MFKLYFDVPIDLTYQINLLKLNNDDEIINNKLMMKG